MIRHYCDICAQEILRAGEKGQYYGGKPERRFKVEINAYTYPGCKKIELCEECINEAINGG